MATLIGRQKIPPSITYVDSILTADLLEVASGVIEIVNQFGSKFKFLKDDMVGNIKKLTAKYETDKEKFQTMKALLQDEVEQKTNKEDKSGTVGGLWLKRGLEYMCEFFLGLVKDYAECKKPGAKNDNNAVKKCLGAAYDLTLTNHHGMASRLLVKTGMQFVPYKDEFIGKLTEKKEELNDKVMEELATFEKAMREYIHQLGKLFQEFGYKDDLLKLTGGGDE